VVAAPAESLKPGRIQGVGASGRGWEYNASTETEKSKFWLQAKRIKNGLLGSIETHALLRYVHFERSVT
jgi:hypothetical protein